MASISHDAGWIGDFNHQVWLEDLASSKGFQVAFALKLANRQNEDSGGRYSLLGRHNETHYIHSFSKYQ